MHPVSISALGIQDPPMEQAPCRHLRPRSTGAVMSELVRFHGFSRYHVLSCNPVDIARFPVILGPVNMSTRSMVDVISRLHARFL